MQRRIQISDFVHLVAKSLKMVSCIKCHCRKLDSLSKLSKAVLEVSGCLFQPLGTKNGLWLMFLEFFQYPPVSSCLSPF